MLTEGRSFERQVLGKCREAQRHPRNLEFPGEAILNRAYRTAGAQMGMADRLLDRQNRRGGPAFCCIWVTALSRSGKVASQSSISLIISARFASRPPSVPSLG